MLQQHVLIRETKKTPYRLKMKAANYDQYGCFVVGRRPLVAAVIISAAKEEVRGSSRKSEKSGKGGGLRWRVE